MSSPRRAKPPSDQRRQLIDHLRCCGRLLRHYAAANATLGAVQPFDECSWAFVNASLITLGLPPIEPSQVHPRTGGVQGDVYEQVARSLESRTAKPKHHGAGLELADGGFRYGGHVHNLTGRPLDMLKALLATRDHRCTAERLISEMRIIDDAMVTFPVQVVKDAATKLRESLRAAAKAAGQRCQNPLPSVGRGRDLTYRLAMP